MAPVTMSELKRVPLSRLKPYPNNPRIGNVEAIAESLRENGQFRPLVVQQKGNIVLAGNHTLRAAKSLGWKDIDVVFVDVDERQARKIVLADNRTATLGSFDNDALAQLLEDLADQGDLAGTGFDAKAVEDLLAVAKPEGEEHQETPENSDEPPASKPGSTKVTLKFNQADHEAYTSYVAQAKAKYGVDSDAAAVLAALLTATAESA